MKSAFIPVVLASLAAAAPVASPVELVERSTPSALYFLENNPSGNNIVTMNIGSNGQLSGTQVIAAGGSGATGNNATTREPVGVDGMFSGGSINVVGNLLFACNAGSGTVSVFNINTPTPNSLSIVNQAANSLGDFPNSVTYSEALNLACVSNTGPTNGVACFNFVPNQGLFANTTLMNKNIITQSNPLEGPFVTYSKVLWNPTSQYLVATIKGNAANVPGRFVYFGWNSNTHSFNAPVISSLTEVPIPFDFHFTSNNEIWVADPSFGAALVSFNSAGQASLVQKVALPNQVMTCWTAVDEPNQTLYAMDAGVNTIYKVSMSGTLLGSFSNANPSSTPGTFDNVLQGGLLYTLIGDTAVDVMDLSNESQYQLWQTSATATDRQWYQGMATWPAS